MLIKNKLSIKKLINIILLIIILVVSYAWAIGINKNIFLLPSKITHIQGDLYLANVNRHWPLLLKADTNDAPTASNLSLYEDKVLLGPRHMVHDAIKYKGNGRYSHWYDNLYFSSSDNSNPKNNGRTYIAKASVYLADSFFVISLLLIGLVFILLKNINSIAGYKKIVMNNLLLKSNYIKRPDLINKIKFQLDNFSFERVKKNIYRAARYVYAIKFQVLISFIPGIIVLLFYPPVFNYIDSYVLLTTGLTILIPHFPPLYPLFLKGITGLFGITDLSIYLIILIQQLLLGSAVLYVITACKNWYNKLVMLTIISAPMFVYLYANGVQTEGMTLIFLIAMYGGMLRIVGGEKKRNLKHIIFYHVILLLLILTRHSMAVFASQLPIYYLARAFFSIKTFRKNLNDSVRYIFAGVLIITLSSIFQNYVVGLIGGNKTSVYGRAVTYRMSYLGLDKINEEKVIHELQKKTDDDLVKKAIEIMITDKSPWVGAYSKVSKIIQERKIPISTDKIINRAAWVYITTPEIALTNNVINTFKNYLGKNLNILNDIVGVSKGSVQLYANNDSVPVEIRNLNMTNNINIQDYEKVFKFIKPDIYAFLNKAYIIVPLAYLISLLLFFLNKESKNAINMMHAITITLILYSFLSSYLTALVWRYAAPVILGSWLILGLSLLKDETNYVRDSGTD